MQNQKTTYATYHDLFLLDPPKRTVVLDIRGTAWQMFDNGWRTGDLVEIEMEHFAPFKVIYWGDGQ